MINKNSKYLFVLIFFVCILSISAISATENTTSKQVTNTDNKEYSLETVNHQYNDDVSNSNENVELKEKENVNDDRQGKSGTDKTIKADNDELTFTDLNTTINDNTNSTIYLSHNYKFNSDTDSGFTSGIPISRNLTVYGNGVTLDGNNMARIFNVTDSSLNVNFYNINFINGNGNITAIGSYSGGAIYGGNAYNCNFTGNNATCSGGAMSYGNAVLCTFNGDTTYGTNIIPAVINVINYTSPYMSGERLKFNLTVDGRLYDGFNTTIKIYKDGSFVKTVYGLVKLIVSKLAITIKEYLI